MQGVQERCREVQGGAGGCTICTSASIMSGAGRCRRCRHTSVHNRGTRLELMLEITHNQTQAFLRGCVELIRQHKKTSTLELGTLASNWPPTGLQLASISLIARRKSPDGGQQHVRIVGPIVGPEHTKSGRMSGAPVETSREHRNYHPGRLTKCVDCRALEAVFSQAVTKVLAKLGVGLSC